MDLKAFFQKVRKIEQDITTQHAVVVSYETPDGGKAGIKTEVGRAVAARMIAEGRARLAQPEEAQEFYENLRRAEQIRVNRDSASRVNVAMLKDEELETLRHFMRKKER